jgi:hypothetical protein
VGRSEQVWKILSPLVFDPRSVQPVDSCDTDYAISAYCHGWQIRHIGAVTDALPRFI